MNDTQSEAVAGIDSKDGLPADGWTRVPESIISRTEIERTAGEASKLKR